MCEPEPVPTGTLPACFDDPRDYCYANLPDAKGHRRACLDCTVPYQLEMMAEGRCTPIDPFATPLARDARMRRRGSTESRPKVTRRRRKKVG